MTYYHEPPRSYYYSPQSSTRPRKRRSTHAVKLGLLVLVLCSYLLVWNLVHLSNQHQADALQALSDTNKKEFKPYIAQPVISQSEFESKLKKIIAQNSDVEISVTIIDLDTNASYDYGLSPTIPYEAASVAKLITAACVLHQVEAGKLSLTQSIQGKSIQSIMQKMIVESDNASWKLLNDKLGHPTLNTYASSIGMKTYDSDVNQVVPKDIALLLQKLYRYQLVTKEHSKLLLSYMANANRTDFLKAGIPSGVSFYHKAGWVEDRDHDAAIIDNGDRRLALVVFTNGHNKPHTTDRSTVLQQIAAVSYDRFVTSQ